VKAVEILFKKWGGKMRQSDLGGEFDVDILYACVETPVHKWYVLIKREIKQKD
jgi:hypothetical protein